MPHNLRQSISCLSDLPLARVLLDRKPAQHLVVLLLSLRQRELGVDFKRLPALVPRIGLNERIVDPLLFQPGEEKMPPFVRGHWPGKLVLARKNAISKLEGYLAGVVYDAPFAAGSKLPPFA